MDVLKLNASQISRYIDKSPSNVSRLLKGEYERVNIDIVQKLMQNLDINPVWLLSEDDEEPMFLKQSNKFFVTFFKFCEMMKFEEKEIYKLLGVKMDMRLDNLRLSDIDYDYVTYKLFDFGIHAEKFNAGEIELVLNKAESFNTMKTIFYNVQSEIPDKYKIKHSSILSFLKNYEDKLLVFLDDWRISIVEFWDFMTNKMDALEYYRIYKIFNSIINYENGGEQSVKKYERTVSSNDFMYL